jgi:hypothetical protein
MAIAVRPLRESLERPGAALEGDESTDDLALSGGSSGVKPDVLQSADFTVR